MSRLEEPRDSVTASLLAWRAGDAARLNDVIDATYQELRRLAAHLMAAERPSHTLQPTAVVHEAYLRLLDADRVDWHDKAHFMAVASRLIRQVLVDHARARGAAKRGDAPAKVTLGIALPALSSPPVEILDLDRALDELALVDAQRSRLVELRWFGGLSVDEVATVLDLSPRTVKRRWRSTRAWLERRLTSGLAGSGAA